MDERGKAPCVATVREMANIFLANRDDTVPPSIVGVNWVNRFIDRYAEL
jgi:hypothetical protein